MLGIRVSQSCLLMSRKGGRACAGGARGSGALCLNRSDSLETREILKEVWESAKERCLEKA